MRKKSELIFNLLLVPLDFLAVTAAFVLAYIIRIKIDGRPAAHPIQAFLFLKIILLIIPVWLFIFVITGMYNLTSQRGRLEEVSKAFVAVSGGTMFMILIDFLFRQPIFPSKAVPIYGFFLSLLFVIAGRQIIRKIQRYLFTYKVGIRRAVLIGSGPIAQKILDDLSSRHSGYEVVAVVDERQPKTTDFEGLETYRDFDEMMKKHREIDEMIQADSGFEAEEVLRMVNYATNHHIAFRFVPNQFGVYAINASVGTLAGMPVMEIKHTPLDGWGRIFKRAFDVVGSAVGLVILSPLFLVIAVAIKLTDNGPVFFVHRRLSRIGKKVGVHKFRTMQARYSGKDPAGVFKAMGRPELASEFKENQKLEDDPRVTPIGSFLRRTSLDELPQLVNVFKGELSLVGPRPIIEDELKHYGSEQAAFLALKPGVTGLWQISGRSDIGYDERVKLDIYYVENWSLLLDIRILAKTILTVFKRRGAY